MILRLLEQLEGAGKRETESAATALSSGFSFSNSFAVSLSYKTPLVTFFTSTILRYLLWLGLLAVVGNYNRPLFSHEKPLLDMDILIWFHF